MNSDVDGQARVGGSSQAEVDFEPDSSEHIRVDVLAMSMFLSFIGIALAAADDDQVLWLRIDKVVSGVPFVTSWCDNS